MIPIQPSLRTWRIGHGRSIGLGPRSCVMGILNVTPDSFSDGGRYIDAAAAVETALRMVEDGADIIDIGGESTRPGAAPVDPSEEQSRVVPVIEALAARTACILSVDTYRSATARLAVEAGAHIVNDVWGAQKDPSIAAVAAQTGAGLCLMHTGRERQTLADVIEDQHVFLRRSLRIAGEAGVRPEAIVVDPGFGFAKDAAENLQLMARLGDMAALGHPILVGASRKRFIRAAIGRDDPAADIATAAAGALMRERGAAIFRVHDVRASRDALAVADAMLAAWAGVEP